MWFTSAAAGLSLGLAFQSLDAAVIWRARGAADPLNDLPELPGVGSQMAARLE